MTDFQRYRERTRDIQDYNERMVWNELEYVDGAGAVIRATGTDTQDEEMPVANFGYGANFPKDYNTEVFAVSFGSDTNQKYAMVTIPRDKQRQWAEGTGGVQHPTDGNRAVEFNGDELWLKDGTVVLGHDKQVRITVEGNTVTFAVNGALDIQSSALTHNGVNISETHVHGGVERGGANTNGPQ